MNYRLLFQDHGGNIYSRADLVAENHEDAIDTARRIYRTGIGAGYEIWTENQRVHTEAAMR